MAASMAVTGSMRIGFLLPSLLAGLGATVLVYDLLRRVRGREVAFAGGLVLLLTFQFVWQFRQAQIDGVLCFFVTLSLYGLLRHLFAGPSLGWFLLGWFAAGLGVITKGVGFLPLLVLLPFVVLAARGWPVSVPHRDPRWWLGPVFFLAAIAVWFVPMMLVTSAGGELLAYRNEILFQQTVTRYADAWHHHEPFWFFLVNVIPVLWLPLTALLPWLWPRWRAALRAGSRDTFVAVLLAWVVIVVLFFSASAGKRGVYVLPAVPALVMAAATWLPEILRLRSTRLLGIHPRRGAHGGGFARRGLRDFRCRDRSPPAGRLRHRALAAAGVSGCRWAAGTAVFPRARRLARLWRHARGVSGHGRTRRISAHRRRAVGPGIHAGGGSSLRRNRATRPHRRQGAVPARARAPEFQFRSRALAREEAEAADAAAWFAARPGRALLADEKALALCFADTESKPLGRANRQHWYLITGGTADEGCVARGDLRRARLYIPPNASINSAR